MSEFAMKRTWGPQPNYPNVLKYEPPNKNFVVISGPCSVESTEQIFEMANFVKQNGATHLRGGVFRAGTYPGKNFGFIQDELIQAYHYAAQAHGLKNIIEVLDYTDYGFSRVAKYADCFQVGCRQQQNYSLLRKLGAYKKPVFLKRHPGSTIDELLGSAEHLLVGGVDELYLIERGTSTNQTHVRWDLSISMIPAVKAICKIPVICDASHGTGRRDLVEPMALAGVAAGAGGVLIEVHHDPENSLSDADQALSKSDYQNLILKLNAVKYAITVGE